jgi:RNA methyltransferase, TrmH family
MAERPQVRGVGPASKSRGGGPEVRTEVRAEIITSRENRWLKMFRTALRGTGPAEGDPLGVEGTKLIEDAVRSGLEAEALLVSGAGERDLARILQAAGESETGIPRLRILRTTDKLFDGISSTDAPQGVAALFRQRAWGFDDILSGAARRDGLRKSEAPLVVVLAGVQDPGNVGTIIRSAEAFGATGVVATRGTADPWSPKALRASAGSALRLPLLRGMAIPVLLTQLRVSKLKVYAASARIHSGANTTDTNSVDFRQPLAIFIGSEGAGLPPEVERAADAMISIQISDAVESLNAGVAASVVLYESARQRNRA